MTVVLTPPLPTSPDERNVHQLRRSDKKVAGRWKARSAWNHRSIRPHVASPRQGRSETRGVRTGIGQRAGMNETVIHGGSYRPCRGFELLSLRSSGGFGRSSLHTPATFFSSLRDSRMRNAECAAVLISPSALPFRNHSFLRHLKTTGANQGAATFLSPWPCRGQRHAVVVRRSWEFPRQCGMSDGSVPASPTGRQECRPSLAPKFEVERLTFSVRRSSSGRARVLGGSRRANFPQWYSCTVFTS